MGLHLFSLIILVISFSLFPFISLKWNLNKKYTSTLILLEIPIILGIFEEIDLINIFNREIWHIIFFVVLSIYSFTIIFCLYEIYNKKILLLIPLTFIVILFFSIDWELSLGILFDKSNGINHIIYDVIGLIIGLIFSYFIFEPI